MLSSWYDLQREESLDAAIADLRGFWKLWSGCLLSAYRLPVLKGIIISRWQPALPALLRQFLRSIDAGAALLRHDKVKEVPPYPRGGFLVPTNALQKIIQRFLAADRIVALYEPVNPIFNGYNMNVLFENPRRAVIEVVGPGFDASDLQRGDLTPHEVLSLTLDRSGRVTNLRTVYRVTRQQYENSAALRIEKLWRVSAQWPYNCRNGLPTGSVSTIADFLRRSGSLLMHSKRYRPISRRRIGITVEAIVRSGVLRAFEKATGAQYPFNVSTSMTTGGRRQVYWDIVSPQLKYQGLGRVAGSPRESGQ